MTLPTLKLYDSDPYLKSCDGVVGSCEKYKDGLFKIELDQTVFFPESGGQPCDLGKIADTRVTDVIIEGDVIYHICEKAVEVGKTVKAEIDFSRRFDLMQQHTGEHLLSAVFLKLFGANNVGFHLNMTGGTIDFDKVLDPDDIFRAENEANRLIYEDPSVRTFYPTAKELKSITPRKKVSNIDGDIRIVEIDGVDVSACCGTHCSSLSQVGIAKITHSQKYKGGMRLSFLCGMRAFRDYSEKDRAMSSLCVLFSAKSAEDAVIAVRKTCSDNEALHHKIASIGLTLSEMTARSLLSGAEHLSGMNVVFGIVPDLSHDSGKALMRILSESKNTISCILFESGDKVFYYSACDKSSPIPAKNICLAANDFLGGKGGGNASFAQGSAPVRPGWRDAAAAIKDFIIRSIS